VLDRGRPGTAGVDAGRPILPQLFDGIRRSRKAVQGSGDPATLIWTDDRASLNTSPAPGHDLVGVAPGGL
jgi:hypothetical protein